MVETTIIERRAVESSSLCRAIASLTMVVLVLGARLDAADPTQQRLASAERPQQQPLRFTRDVVPALTKAGCNSGACHGSFLGRGGLQLSLLGFDAAFDHEVLTKASRRRRVNVSAPEQSLLLPKLISVNRLVELASAQVNSLFGGRIAAPALLLEASRTRVRLLRMDEPAGRVGLGCTPNKPLHLTAAHRLGGCTKSVGRRQVNFDVIHQSNYHTPGVALWTICRRPRTA